MRRRDKKKDSEENDGVDSNAWMVTFSDLLNLLLTFFVLLLTMSSLDQKSLKAMFSVYSGAANVLLFSSIANISQPIVIPVIFNRQVDTSMIRDIINAYSNSDDGFGMIEEAQSHAVKAKKMLDALNKNIQGEITIKINRQGLVMSFPDNILFGIGRSELKKEIYYILKEIISIVKGTKLNVRIEGHTDNIPINTSKFSSNFQLSAYRSVNVLKLFIQEGLPANRLSAFGYGEYKPVTTNMTKWGRARNRRVELILTRKRETKY